MKRGWTTALGAVAASVAGRLGAAVAAAILVALVVGWLGFSGVAAATDALRAAGAQQAYEQSAAALQWRLAAGVVAGGLGIACILLLAWALLRTLRGSVSLFETYFRSVVRGDLGAEIAIPPAREFYQMASMLRAMRAHLQFQRWERTELEQKAASIRRETVSSMADAIEQEAGLAVSRVAERTGAMARDSDAMAASAERVSANSQLVSGAADQALKNAQVVAAASEELAASIRSAAARPDKTDRWCSAGAAMRRSDSRSWA